jgi:hypothetical protein
MHHRRQLGRPRARAGFALLITITLVAFLVLVLVTMATLTRVETSIAVSSQQSNQARQNAMMALNIAIGELQKYTGPDQRTTARADMDATLANVTNANGRWVGAYGNATVIDTAYAGTPSAIPGPILTASDTKGSQARLLNWLVSGNEATVFDPATAVSVDGHIITPPSSFAFTPTSTTNLATTNVTPAIADTQTLLVGPNSAAVVSDYVSAPLKTIQVPAGILPGFDSTDTTATDVGRYAWWVGDEGAKARVNLPMASSLQAPAAFVSAQRAAIELIDGENPVGATTATDLIGAAAYDPTLPTITNVAYPRQLAFQSAAAGTSLPTALRLRFHDHTASSVAVLADTYAGGLKKDLSAVLANGATSPADADFIFAPDVGGTFGMPTWGRLRSFARITVPADGIDPRLPDSTHAGISPVLTYASLGMRYIAPEGDSLEKPIRLALYPLAVVWNPYTFPIKGAKYEVGFTRRGINPIQLQVDINTDPTAPAQWRSKETLDFNRGFALIKPTTNASFPTRGDYEADAPPSESYVRFVIDAPDLPAGASLIFTLQDDDGESGKDYTAPPTGAPENRLTKGLNPSGHVLVNKGASYAADEVGRPFRLAINTNMLPPYPWGWTQGTTTSMSGGEVAAYLGEIGSPRTGYSTSAANDMRWYQSITRVSPARDGSVDNVLLQSDAPLSIFAGPSAVLSFAMVFDGAKSTRWLAQGNPRALVCTRAPGSGVVLNYKGGLGMATAWQSFSSDSDGLRASAGNGLDSASSIVDATLFDQRPDNQPLLSLGQLQHADLAWIHAYPAYAIGNSLGDFHFKSNRSSVSLNMSGMMSGANSPTTNITTYYDLSWLLNRALWDRYFVSTVPHAGTGQSTDTDMTDIPDVLPNPRMQRHGDPSDASLRDASTAAASLMVAGGFNINSTSEQAWRAVLGGANRLAYDPVNADESTTPLQAALSRFTKPTAAPAIATDHAWAWQSYRQLTEVQIATLATNIVAEIRQRGPFVSLADFINRRLVDNAATTGAHANEQFHGVIQAAINIAYTGSTASNSGDALPFGSDTAPDYRNESSYDMELVRGYQGSVDGKYPIGSISAFAPQFLTQADVLSTIGSGLSARSDTFTIRAYGDTINPITNIVQGRAWCEAVVQRLPAYLEPGDDNPEDTPAANSVNRRLGRRYEIISFQWLSPDDI